MSTQPPRLRRRLLGYSPQAVHQVLTSWDAMIRRANGRTRTAEERMAGFHTELAQARELVSRKEQEIQTLRQQMRSLNEQTERSRRQATESARRGELTAKLVAEELATLLRAAEESAGRIIDRARSSTEERVAEVERLWSDVGAHMARFAAWHEQVEPVIRSAQSKLQEAEARIEEVPERIRDALTPIFKSFDAVRSDFAQVAKIATPPILVLPDELEAEEADETERTHSEQLVARTTIGKGPGGAAAEGRSDRSVGTSEPGDGPPAGRPQPGTGA